MSRARFAILIAAAVHAGPHGPRLAAQGDRWPSEVKDIRYESAADSTRQPALFYRPPSKRPAPLLVGLHTWSGDYRQSDSVPYAQWCIRQGWAFVHPSFRGPNRRPEATGSDLVVGDILSAVDYAKKNANVDADRVYLIGTSGGGYAALLMAGRHPDLWAGVSAWVPIFDLAAWHRECKLAGRRYWREIEASCGGAPGTSPTVDAEYRRRSASTYLARARGVHLDINAGIHDGHTGSVPVRHSLEAFNALAAETERFSEREITWMVQHREAPEGFARPAPDPEYGAKQPLVRRRSGRTRVTLFDGGHEGLPGAALAWLRRQHRQKPWALQIIDPATDAMRGADGVRLGDANGDGLLDTVTGWEEGRAIRVCMNPGPARAREPWPSVTVGRVRSAEDAVFADVDGDGRLDVVSSTEGRSRTVFVHWAPADPGDYLDATAWRTAEIPATAGRQAWMFALPMDIDGENGVDLVVGSKGQGGTVSWLRSPKNPRHLDAWTLEKIIDAGWIMTLRSNGSGTELAPIFVTDRKPERRGVYRLSPRRTASGVEWTRKNLGGADHEVMFMDLWPESQAPLVATRNGVILDLAKTPAQTIENPFDVPWGKAVRLGDIDGDGEPDIVHTANTGRSPNRPGVTWLTRIDGRWHPRAISTTGTKFDRIELLDLDGDGDLDVITCEENAGENSRGLGLIWYENPHMHN